MAREGCDWDLFSRADKDNSALMALFERHRHFVYRVAWGILNENAAAEDVVQEIFLLMKAGKLKAQKSAKFTTWLYKVVVNSSRASSRKRFKMWGSVAAQDVLEGKSDPNSNSARLDKITDLSRALANLPLRQREVVVLRFLEGCSTAETAEILGCREGTVKAHLNRATRFLRKELSTNSI